MQFLFPGVLWGLLALSIPVIVHLFNFRKTKKVFFTNVALLKSVETKTSAFRKLKRWLLLASRMLALLCLVLAFAQPVLFNGSDPKMLKNPGINGIYLDNSLSMQNTTENKRFLDLAAIKIDELLSIFTKSSNIQLSTNDFDGEDQFVLNASKIKDRLTSLTFSEIPRTLEQVYKRQKSIAQKQAPSARNHFFWFSDFQKSTAGPLNTLKIDSLDTVHLIPIKGQTTQNVFIDSVWLETPTVREMQNNRLQLVVRNAGTKAVEKLPLKLYIDGVQTSTTSVNIAPNAKTSGMFNFTVKDKGIHKAKIIFDDQPVTFDNDYYFVLNASASIHVLHIYNQRSTQNYLGKMFANDSLFKYTSFGQNNLDPGQIQNADLVVLEGLNQIDNELKANLETFLSAGGSVCICPPENTNVASYQGFLGQYSIQNLEQIQVLPDAKNFVDINEPDKASPFYKDVFEKGTFNGLVSLPKAHQKLKWGGAVEKLLSFKNGQNFLTKTRASEGLLYFMAAPLSTSYGNFAEHAFFVPTFYNMAYQSSKSEQIAYSFKSPTLQFFMPNAPKNASYKLKGSKVEILPVQRVIGKTLLLELPKSADLADGVSFSSGFYDLVIDGKVEKTLAINHDNQESLMECYTLKELETLFDNQDNVKVYNGIFDGSFIEAFRQTSLSKPLWKYFIMAALAFLCIEILIARLMKN